MCVGHPGDIARFCRAIHEIQNGPDFITIDGAEGGTGGEYALIRNLYQIYNDELYVTWRVFFSISCSS